MANRLDEIVSDIVIKNSLITPEMLNTAIKEANATSRPLVSVLAHMKIATEQDIMKLVAQRFNLEFVNLKSLKIEKQE